MGPKKKAAHPPVTRALRSVTELAVSEDVSPRPVQPTLGDYMGKLVPNPVTASVATIPTEAAPVVPSSGPKANVTVSLLTANLETIPTEAVPVTVPVVVPAPVVPPPDPKAKVPLRKFADMLRSSSKGMALDFVPLVDDKVVIELDDIKEEIAFWDTTLVGTVLGRRVNLAQLHSLVHKH
ncbi:hypothetical protein vseg_013496 [Gypsophila vaccaria]